MTSLRGENEQLQNHLRDADFFDVVRYSTATFRLTNLDSQEARGDLTIKGVTRPIRFSIRQQDTPKGRRIGGRVVIDRTKFGIRYNSTSFFGNLGDQAIRNEFELLFDMTVPR